jgi:hypothetical protein
MKISSERADAIGAGLSHKGFTRQKTLAAECRIIDSLVARVAGPDSVVITPKKTMALLKALKNANGMRGEQAVLVRFFGTISKKK